MDLVPEQSEWVEPLLDLLICFQKSSVLSLFYALLRMHHLFFFLRQVWHFLDFGYLDSFHSLKCWQDMKKEKIDSFANEITK